MTDLVTNDTGSKLQVTCTDNDTGAAISISGATVNLRWTDEAGAVQTRVMTLTDPPNGVCEYQFLAGEIVYPKMSFEVEITDSSGFITSNLSLIELTVREELG